MRRATVIVLTIYWLLIVFVLIAFLMAPADGLANVWIAVITLPVTMIAIPVLDWGMGIGFPFIPLGYHAAHSVYLVGSALIISFIVRNLAGGNLS